MPGHDSRDLRASAAAPAAAPQGASAAAEAPSLFPSASGGASGPGGALGAGAAALMSHWADGAAGTVARAGAGAQAVARIAGEDLRMLLEKVTGKTLARGPGDLSGEQAAADAALRGGRDGHGQASAHAAPARAAPHLARPVLMIPGLTMQAASFDALTGHMGATGRNGGAVIYAAKERQFHVGGLSGPIATREQLRAARQFVLQYSDPNGAPSEKEPEIAAAMSAIQSATGADTVDVVTHSAGGTDFRLYLEDRKPESGPKIGNTVMIGPAVQGTEMGNLGAAVGGPLGVQRAGAELAVGSPLIDMLNRRWDHQRQQITGDITIIAVTGAPTPSRDGVKDGDGYMPADELHLPGASTVVLRGLDPTAVAHLREVEYSGVIAAVEDGLRRGQVEPGHR